MTLPLLALLALPPTAQASETDSSDEGLSFADLEADRLDASESWERAAVPRNAHQDLARAFDDLAMDLGLLDLYADGPVYAREESPHRYVIDSTERRLEYQVAAGAWLDTAHDWPEAATTLSEDMARRVAVEALRERGVEPNTRNIVVRSNVRRVLDDDSQPISSEVVSRTVFFAPEVDGVPVFGGGGMSSVIVAGSPSAPAILSVGHQAPPGDGGTAAMLSVEAGELLDEASARRRLLRGEVLAAASMPAEASEGTIEAVDRAWFSDGAHRHAEAIPVYVYRVNFLQRGTEEGLFQLNYAVSAVTDRGWHRLGYDEVERSYDSRYRSDIPREQTPDVQLWSYAEWNERNAWPSDLEVRVQPVVVNRDSLCSSIQASLALEDRQWVGTARWKLVDQPPARREAYLDMLDRGFANACWAPNEDFASAGLLTDTPIPGATTNPLRPHLGDIVDAAGEGRFLVHLSHAWGAENVECGGAALYPNRGLAPSGFSVVVPGLDNLLLLPPSLNPYGNFSSCKAEEEWEGSGLDYFLSHSSFMLAGTNQWERAVGGGTDNLKLVIGNVSHGNRFYIRQWTTRLFDELARMRCLSDGAKQGTAPTMHCVADGRSFSEALQIAAQGTAATQADYGWWGGEQHPKQLRMIASTRTQLDHEALPGWGPQFPNDGNRSGVDLIVEGF